MSDEFSFIYESFGNDAVFSNINNEIKSYIKFISEQKSISQNIINKENEITSALHDMIINVKKCMCEIKYFDSNVAQVLNCMLSNFENIYSFRIEQFNTKLMAMTDFNKRLTEIIDLILIKKKIEKSKIKASQRSLYFNYPNAPILFTSNKDILESINNYKLQKSSFLKFNKDSSICLQMMNSTSIINLFDIFIQMPNNIIFNDFTENSLNLKQEYLKNIIDFGNNKTAYFSRYVVTDITYSIKDDYDFESYLIKRNEMGNQNLVYAVFDKSKMQFITKNCEESSNTVNIIDVLELAGDPYDMNNNNLIVTSKEKKRYTFKTLNKDNLLMWINKFDRTLNLQKSNESENISDVNKSVENIEESFLKIDNIFCLVSIIESGSPAVYLCLKAIDKNFELPIDLNKFFNKNMSKKNTTEACYALRYYMDNSKSLIHDEIYEKYISVEKNNIDDLKNLVKLIPSENLKILSVLFYHFKKMVDYTNPEHIYPNSLALIFGPLMNKKLILNGNKINTINHQCNLFNDFLLHTEELFQVYNKDEIDCTKGIERTLIYENANVIESIKTTTDTKEIIYNNPSFTPQKNLEILDKNDIYDEITDSTKKNFDDNPKNSLLIEQLILPPPPPLRKSKKLLKKQNGSYIYKVDEFIGENMKKFEICSQLSKIWNNLPIIDKNTKPNQSSDYYDNIEEFLNNVQSTVIHKLPESFDNKTVNNSDFKIQEDLANNSSLNTSDIKMSSCLGSDTMDKFGNNKLELIKMNKHVRIKSAIDNINNKNICIEKDSNNDLILEKRKSLTLNKFEKEDQTIFENNGQEFNRKPPRPIRKKLSLTPKQINENEKF